MASAVALALSLLTVQCPPAAPMGTIPVKQRPGATCCRPVGRLFLRTPVHPQYARLTARCSSHAHRLLPVPACVGPPGQVQLLRMQLTVMRLMLSALALLAALFGACTCSAATQSIRELLAPLCMSAVCAVRAQSPRAPQEARGQGGDNLRSRWAAVSSRCRESLSKTTRELKGRWGGATTHRSSGEGDSMQPYTSHSHQPPNGSAPGSSASSALPADERARAGVQG